MCDAQRKGSIHCIEDDVKNRHMHEFDVDSHEAVAIQEALRREVVRTGSLRSAARRGR